MYIVTRLLPFHVVMYIGSLYSKQNEPRPDCSLFMFLCTLLPDCSLFMLLCTLVPDCSLFMLLCTLVAYIANNMNLDRIPPFHVFMYIGSLYCKQYGPRPDCSLFMLLCTLVAYIANKMDLDQTAPFSCCYVHW